MNGYQRRNGAQDTPSKTTLILLGVLAFLILLNVLLFKTVVQTQLPPDTLPQNYVIPVDEEEEERKRIEKNFDFITLYESDIYAGDLVLVNADYQYKFDNVPTVLESEEIVSVYEHKTKDYYVSDRNIRLSKRIIENLNAFFAEYKKTFSRVDIMLNSAHRTYEQQEEMLASKIKQLGEEEGSRTAAVAGSSEHHTGLTFDICINSNGKYSAFDGTGDYAWIAQNCHKYGLILRYPEHKSESTGILYEPWHYRYIGVPHSYYIYNNGLILEEYIEKVKNYSFDKKHLTITADAETYEVYFVKSEGATTSVPVMKNCEYRISGNNSDGFIVCCKTK